MENYQLFMIADRQHRIDENINEMTKIKADITKYSSIISKILLMKREYVSLKEQLQSLDNDYKKQNTKKTLYYKSDCIQSLSEAIIEKNEQIKFVNCLKVGYQSKISSKLLSFKEFYKYKKQVAYDEKEESISLLHAVYQYIKQYKCFKKNISSIIQSNDIISALLLKYEIEKRRMVAEVEKLNTELDDRKQLLWNYKKNRSVLEQKLQETKDKINQLLNSYEYMMYKKKIKQFLDLDIQNQNYQGQIENIKGINNQQYSKQKKCA